MSAYPNIAAALMPLGQAEQQKTETQSVPKTPVAAAMSPYLIQNQNANWQWQYAKPGKYVTTLASNEESAFQQWVKQNHIPWQDDPHADYDMRGFWKELQANPQGAMTAINPNDHKMHFTDKYKTPYHKSFSRESMYALPTAPKWINSHQLAGDNGQIFFDELPSSGTKNKNERVVTK